LLISSGHVVYRLDDPKTDTAAAPAPTTTLAAG
jgi:hypothetical protein